MTYRTILILLVGLALIGLYACDRENTVESPDNLGKVTPGDSTPPDSLVGTDTLTYGAVLYVAKGGSGTGTSSSPFGSIQQAIDAAVTAGGEHTILIGLGTYNEQVTLASNVHLRGRRNPDNNWEATGYGPTIITYAPASGNAIAVIARDLDHKTILENITIVGGDAPNYGASSVGLYEIDSDSLVLVRCEVRGGRGGDGAPGIDGVDGVDGLAGDPGNPTGGPRCGGAGGAGAAICPNDDRSDGEAGYCGDGSQTGGAGGLGDGINSLETRGAAGDAGVDGVDGVGGVMTIALDAASFPMFLSDSGTSGTDGISGCGGGGGGGGPCFYELDSVGDTVWVGVEDGGWGGWGGERGTAGTGGGGAGHSIGMMMLSSTAMFESVKLVGDDGAHGGDGGIAGHGGNGGAGSRWISPDSGTRYYAPGVQVGGRGGAGGAGGDAGSGGGGAGGHSFSLVKYQSTVLSEDDVHYSFGPAGTGGTSEVNPGDDGVADSIYVVP